MNTETQNWEDIRPKFPKYLYKINYNSNICFLHMFCFIFPVSWPEMLRKLNFDEKWHFKIQTYCFLDFLDILISCNYLVIFWSYFFNFCDMQQLVNFMKP